MATTAGRIRELRCSRPVMRLAGSPPTGGRSRQASPASPIGYGPGIGIGAGTSTGMGLTVLLCQIWHGYPADPIVLRRRVHLPGASGTGEQGLVG